MLFRSPPRSAGKTPPRQGRSRRARRRQRARPPRASSATLRLDGSHPQPLAPLAWRCLPWGATWITPTAKAICGPPDGYSGPAITDDLDSPEHRRSITIHHASYAPLVWGGLIAGAPERLGRHLARDGRATTRLIARGLRWRRPRPAARGPRAVRRDGRGVARRAGRRRGGGLTRSPRASGARKHVEGGPRRSEERRVGKECRL